MKLKLLLFFITASVSINLTQAQVIYTLQRTLDIRKAMSLDMQYGIRADASLGKAEVRVYWKQKYEEVVDHAPDTSGRFNYSLIYGAYLDDISVDVYKGKSWGYVQWWSSPGFQPISGTSTLYKAALARTLRDGIPWRTKVIDVVIELSVQGGVKLHDIQSVRLPGIDPILGQEFSPSAYKLELFNDAKRYTNYVMLAAHRGYWADAGVSENTIHACRLAMNLGADMLEVDVRLSGDSVPMLLHDPCLHGTTTSIKTKTAAELMTLPTYDRFGHITTYTINSLEQLLDSLATKTIISLDIKDINVEGGGQEWDACFKKCLQLVRSKNLFHVVLFKGSTDRVRIEQLMATVDPALNFSTVQYTPVLYGDRYWNACGGGSGGSGGSGTNDGGGSGTADGSSSGGSGASGGQFGSEVSLCFGDFKNEWYPLFQSGLVKSVETHFKVNSDPLFRAGVVKWLQEAGVRVGVFSFTADSPQGVINTDNGCNTTIREYYHDPNYNSLTKPPFLNDGRGNLDWIFSKGTPTYIIHDRPDLVLNYLNVVGLRDLELPAISRISLPDTISLQDNSLIVHNHKDFDGIALKINDLSRVEFFTPDTRTITAKPFIVQTGESLPVRIENPDLQNTSYLVAGLTSSTMNLEYYNGRTSMGLKTNPETCQSIYGSLTTKLDQRSAPYSSKFQFPHRTLPEWSLSYPGYDIYLNSNYWSTDGLTGNQTASERPEYWLPCTDVYGLWVSNGVTLSNWVDPYDPSSRTENGCEKDTNGVCIPGTQFDGRFDAFVIYTDGEVEMIPVSKLSNGYLDLLNLKRTSDQKSIRYATSGYMVATGGVPIDTAKITKKFNNDQPEKMRTIMGLRGNEMIIVSIQSPQLEVREVADLMLNYYHCAEVMINDSGRSTGLLTNVGNFPIITETAAQGIKAGTTPNGLDSGHLNQFFGLNAPQVYRNIGTFLAIRKK